MRVWHFEPDRNVMRAVTEASVYLCEAGEAEAAASVSVTAIATAWVELVTKINNDCVAKGTASACTWLEAQIEAAAVAYANVRLAAIHVCLRILQHGFVLLLTVHTESKLSNASIRSDSNCAVARCAHML